MCACNATFPITNMPIQNTTERSVLVVRNMMGAPSLYWTLFTLACACIAVCLYLQKICLLSRILYLTDTCRRFEIEIHAWICDWLNNEKNIQKLYTRNVWTADMKEGCRPVVHEIHDKSPDFGALDTCQWQESTNWLHLAAAYWSGHNLGALFGADFSLPPIHQLSRTASVCCSLAPCPSLTVITLHPCTQLKDGLPGTENTLSSLPNFAMTSLQQSFIDVASALSSTSTLGKSRISQRVHRNPQYFINQFRSLKATAHVTQRNATQKSVSPIQVLQPPWICSTRPWCSRHSPCHLKPYVRSLIKHMKVKIHHCILIPSYPCLADRSDKWREVIQNEETSHAYKADSNVRIFVGSRCGTNRPFTTRWCDRSRSYRVDWYCTAELHCWVFHTTGSCICGCSSWSGSWRQPLSPRRDDLKETGDWLIRKAMFFL